MNILCISLPGALQYEFSVVIGLLGSGGSCFPLLEAICIKRIIGIEIRQVLFKTENRKIKTDWALSETDSLSAP